RCTRKRSGIGIASNASARIPAWPSVYRTPCTAAATDMVPARRLRPTRQSGGEARTARTCKAESGEGHQGSIRGGPAMTARSTARYQVTTWDTDKEEFTPQRGVRKGPYTLLGLRKALRELRKMSYGIKRYDDAMCVLVERIR